MNSVGKALGLRGTSSIVAVVTSCGTQDCWGQAPGYKGQYDQHRLSPAVNKLNMK